MSQYQSPFHLAMDIFSEAIDRVNEMLINEVQELRLSKQAYIDLLQQLEQTKTELKMKIYSQQSADPYPDLEEDIPKKWIF